MARKLSKNDYVLFLILGLTLCILGIEMNVSYSMTESSYSDQFDTPVMTENLHSGHFDTPAMSLVTDKNICDTARQNFQTASRLFGIVTGSEHSGTTIVSQLIMSAPGVYGGVECGMLLASEPFKFKRMRPFYNWMKGNESDRMWNLNSDQQASLLNSTCHAEMYIRLRKYSSLFSRPPNDKSWILDKTPRYVFNLVDIMDRTPGVPVVATQKSHADQVMSLMKRKHSILKAEGRATQADANLRAALEKYPDRLFIVNMTTFYLDIHTVMGQVFDFLNLTWQPEYLTMEALNSKSMPGARQTLPFDFSARTSSNRTRRFTDWV